MVGRNSDCTTGSMWSRASCSAGTITVPALGPVPVSAAGDVALAAAVPAALRAESDSAFDREQAPNARLATPTDAHTTMRLPRIGSSALERGKWGTGRTLEIGDG